MNTPTINKIATLKLSDFNSLGETWNKILSHYSFLGEITVYEDPYMDNDHIYRGRKENGPTFLIVSTNISKVISNLLLRKERKEKLNKLNEY